MTPGDPDDSFAAPYVVVHTGDGPRPQPDQGADHRELLARARPRAARLPVALQADLLNAFDTQGVYNIQSVFGGTHVIPPRRFAVRATVSF